MSFNSNDTRKAREFVWLHVKALAKLVGPVVIDYVATVAKQAL